MAMGSIYEGKERKKAKVNFIMPMVINDPMLRMYDMVKVNLSLQMGIYLLEIIRKELNQGMGSSLMPMVNAMKDNLVKMCGMEKVLFCIK